MAIEIIPPDELATLAALPAVEEGSPPQLTVALEAGGEAIFRIPTVRDLKAIEREFPKLGKADQFRELANFCCIQWGDQPKAPSDDEIDALDDQAVLKAFADETKEPIDETLEQLESESLSYEVLPDRTHRVQLNAGYLIFRRPTRKDVKSIEANTTKGGTHSDVLAAVKLTAHWWGEDKRSIMPADFDGLTLREFRRIGDAIAGFFERSSRSH